MPKILITGAAGYIGSHCLIDLLEQGYDIISLDSHVRANGQLIEAAQTLSGKTWPHYQIDLCNADALGELFAKYTDIESVIHFAALKSVPESVAKPLAYYRNNIMGLHNLLEAMQAADVRQLIFSSSCSVYGATKQLPVDEQTPWEAPESPYAHTKQIGERMILDFARSWPAFRACLLRYFNPAGAHPSGRMGEIAQEGAYNVVPILLECHLGLRPQFQVFGSDYATRDGSCLRDYIHIMDLASAHRASLEYLPQLGSQKQVDVFNIGTGAGQTVLEILAAFSKAVGKELPYSLGPRRAGDVPAIYAKCQKAQERLAWQALYSLDEIMQSAWAWEQYRRNK